MTLSSPIFEEFAFSHFVYSVIVACFVKFLLLLFLIKYWNIFLNDACGDFL